MLSWGKFGKIDAILPKKQFRFSANVLQTKIACFSSSIALAVQYLQNLEAIGVTGLVYRPDSNPRLALHLHGIW